MASSAVLVAEKIYQKYYISKTDAVDVLCGIDLSIQCGEIIFLRGPSGSGKSTLLSILAGLEHPTQGRVIFDGISLYNARNKKISMIRNRKMGFIFQSYFLLPDLTVIENVMLPSIIQGKKNKKVAEKLIEEVGLSHRHQHLPSQLSGGEKQRVAIARALINKPSIIFADEPTGNLDNKTGAIIADLLLRLVVEYSSTLITVTHDSVLSKRGNRELFLNHGLLNRYDTGFYE